MIRPVALFWASLAGVLLVAAYWFTGPPAMASAANCGLASWYGAESGSVTANGEAFNGESMTAAHKTMPFGTKLRVSFTNKQGVTKTVIVRINDRGPYIKGRVLDLSHAAAKRIGLTAAGVGRVCWTRL